jgi:hypothetical protein
VAGSDRVILGGEVGAGRAAGLSTRTIAAHTWISWRDRGLPAEKLSMPATLTESINWVELDEQS